MGDVKRVIVGILKFLSIVCYDCYTRVKIACTTSTRLKSLEVVA
jgi:hypothetical protein